MQRPEAWPRPHPGEGAAAAPAGGPAPPARGREPAGLRVRSGRHRGPSGRRQLPSRPLSAGELGAARTGWGGAAPAQAEKFLRADSGGGRSGVRLGEVLEQSAWAGGWLGGAGLRFSRRVREPRGRPGPRADLQEPSLYTIKAVFILDNDGHRLLAKYYDDTFPSMKEQMAFEKNVFNKTSRTDSEIAFFGGMTIVYKSSIDLFLYVVGSSYENELMLMSVLTCLFESLNHVLSPHKTKAGARASSCKDPALYLIKQWKNVEKRWLLENMDGAFLVLDEIVDGGVILESDPQQVIQKVNFRVLQSAKEQIKWSLLK
uniref:Coatomer subunit zeta n=1 Tax=Balaenoptera musculus TaxID=9771 RepID=A0A8C0I4Y4_BALMU